MINLLDRVKLISVYESMPDELRTEILRTCVLSELTINCNKKGITPDKPVQLKTEARLLSDQISNWLIEFTE